MVIGLLPAFAGWAALLIQNVFFFLDGRLQAILLELGTPKSYHFNLSDLSPHVPFLPYALGGVLSLSQGFLLTSMVWAAMVVFLLERDFLKSSLWALVGTTLSLFGFIHAYELAGNAILNQFAFFVSWQFPVAYLALAVLFFLAYLANRYFPEQKS